MWLILIFFLEQVVQDLQYCCGMEIDILKKELKNKHYGSYRIYYSSNNWCNYRVSA